MNEFPKRIVSLVPSITATLCDFGMEKQLVGRTKFCIRDKEKLQHVPVIGGTKVVDYDMIEKVRPDFIICNKEENTREMVETLTKHYKVWVSDIRTVEDNFKLIDFIAHISCKQAFGNELNNRLRLVFDSVKNLYNGQKILYFIWYKPWMCVGNDTFINAVLEHLGYVNILVATSEERYPVFVPENFADAHEVEKILLSSEPFPFKLKHLNMLQIVFPKADIQFVNGEWYSWYGSSMLSLEKLLITDL